MASEQSCYKVVLAESASIRIIHCQRHQMVELEIGPISMRLHKSSFSTLGFLIAEATSKLDRQETSYEQAYEVLMRKLRNQ